jgi:hypothetical protein
MNSSSSTCSPAQTQAPCAISLNQWNGGLVPRLLDASPAATLIGDRLTTNAGGPRSPQSLVTPGRIDTPEAPVAAPPTTYRMRPDLWAVRSGNRGRYCSRSCRTRDEEGELVSYPLDRGMHIVSIAVALAALGTYRHRSAAALAA